MNAENVGGTAAGGPENLAAQLSVGVQALEHDGWVCHDAILKKSVLTCYLYITINGAIPFQILNGTS